jgi:hypothetical protein
MRRSKDGGVVRSKTRVDSEVEGSSYINDRSEVVPLR